MRKLSTLLAVVALSSSSAAFAAPLVNLQVLGSTTPNGTYTSSLQVTPGETIYYEVVGQLAAIGTTNSTANKTITSINSSSGTTTQDGMISLSFVLSNQGSSAIPVAFSSDALDSGFNGGTGANAGTVGANGITSIRPILGNGVPAEGANAVEILSGSFTVDPATTLGSSTNIAVSFGGTAGSFRINGGANVFTSTSTENGADPYVGYAPLTLSTASATVPEPASLGILAVSAIGLVARRRR